MVVMAAAVVAMAAVDNVMVCFFFGVPVVATRR